MAIYAALIAAAGQLLTTGKNVSNTQTTATPSGGGGAGTAQGIFSQQQPTPKAQPLAPIAGDSNDQLATTLALLGDAPKAEAKAQTQAAQANPTADTPNPSTPGKQPSIGDILSAGAKALGSLAPLLTGNGSQNRIVTGPAAGGPGGQVVQGFQLPQRQTLGQILANLPR